MHNRALYIALRLAARLLPHIPLRLLYSISALAAILYFRFVPAARAGILANLAVARPDLTAEARQTIARAAFISNAHNWVDTLRIPRLQASEIRGLVQIEGWEHLEEARAIGRGVLVVSMHLGNFDLVGQLLAANGLVVTVPVERIQPPELFDFLTTQRESQGIHTVPLDRAPRRMVEALRRGEIVALTADRLLAGKSLAVDFFGRPTPLPRGLASLARHSGAPVVFGVGLRSGFRAYRGYVAPPLWSAHTDDPTEDERALLQGLARLMQAIIRQYPGQWIAFSPLWPDDADLDSTATMSRQTGAAV